MLNFKQPFNFELHRRERCHFLDERILKVAQSCATVTLVITATGN